MSWNMRRTRTLLIGLTSWIVFAWSASPAQSLTGTGAVRIFDRPHVTNDVVLCDSLHMTMTDVTPPETGTGYYAWLVDDSDQPSLFLGPLDVQSGTISFGYASTVNLVDSYKGIVITQESDVFGGTTPTMELLRFEGYVYSGTGAPGGENALTYIRNVLGSFQTPNNLGLMTQMVRQLFKTDNLVQHATFAAGSGTVGNVKTHTNHSYDFVSGFPDPRVASGSVANNSDPLGYGLRRYVDIDTSFTSLGGAGYHIQNALSQADTTPAMTSAANATLAALYNTFGVDNASGLAKELTDKCLEIIGKTYANIGAAQADAIIMKSLATQLQDSIFAAYDRALGMATIPVEAIMLPPSAAPELFTPDDSAKSVPTDPTLSWFSIAEADSYRVDLMQTPDPMMPPDILIFSALTADTSVAAGVLEYGSHYRWTVAGRNAGGEGPASSRDFWTTLEQPILHAPDHQAQNVSLSPLLAWFPVAAADSYRVVLGEIPGGPTILDTLVVDTSLAVGPLGDNTQYEWSVAPSYVGGEGPSASRTFTTLTTTSVEEVDVPLEFALEQNYPNPFNPVTGMTYQVPDDGHVRLTVYNLLGGEVAKLVDRFMPAGVHSVTWDGSDSPTGVYVFRLESVGVNGQRLVATRRGVLLK